MTRKHLGRGGLLLQRLAQLAVALLQLLEQPSVLDGDDRLVANVSSSAICCSVNGRTSVRCSVRTPIGAPRWSMATHTSERTTGPRRLRI